MQTYKELTTWINVIEVNALNLFHAFSKGYLLKEIEKIFSCFYRVYGNTRGTREKLEIALTNEVI